MTGTVPATLPRLLVALAALLALAAPAGAQEPAPADRGQIVAWSIGGEVEVIVPADAPLEDRDALGGALMELKGAGLARSWVWETQCEILSLAWEILPAFGATVPEGVPKPGTCPDVGP